MKIFDPDKPSTYTPKTYYRSDLSDEQEVLPEKSLTVALRQSDDWMRLRRSRRDKWMNIIWAVKS